MSEFIQGFFLQASLILALGAQNLFVIESGLRKRHHLLVATVCSLCDASLILFGVLGTATVFVQLPEVKILFGILGVGFLAFYGWMKLRETPKLDDLHELKQGPDFTAKTAILHTIAFSLLNPHVYLDTVILIGGYSAKFTDITLRGWFGLGAASFSVLWFFGLSLLSAKMSRILSHPDRMRMVFRVSGMILIALAFKLGREVLNWCGVAF
jgi:L-lysine exporter family protein LysE/ArgO